MQRAMNLAKQGLAFTEHQQQCLNSFMFNLANDDLCRKQQDSNNIPLFRVTRVTSTDHLVPSVSIQTSTIKMQHQLFSNTPNY